MLSKTFLSQFESFFLVTKPVYFQWVPLYLLLLSALFYVPRVIWGKLEGGVQKYVSSKTSEPYE